MNDASFFRARDENVQREAGREPSPDDDASPDGQVENDDPPTTDGEPAGPAVTPPDDAA